MTPEEFGTWLKLRMNHNQGNFYDSRPCCDEEYERSYARMSESEDIYDVWMNVDWEAHWLLSPASTEGTQHSASSQTQRKTRSQDVTLPEPESPETT